MERHSIQVPEKLWKRIDAKTRKKTKTTKKKDIPDVIAEGMNALEKMPAHERLKKENTTLKKKIASLEGDDTKPKTPSKPLNEPYELIHECQFYSEYPSKPEYVKCRKENYWKILKRKECEACSRYACIDITEGSRKYEKIKQMTSIEEHHLAELQSERTRLNEEIRLLKEKAQPKIVERVVERIVEVPTVDEGTRQGIKQLETDLKYWKEEAHAIAEKMGPLQKELEIAKKHQTMFICPKKNWIPYEYCKKECPELIDCPWFSMVRENMPIMETR